jgi:hypothetical protein
VDYAEITAAELRKLEDGALQVLMCFWDDEREISIVCEDVRFHPGEPT